MKRTWAGLTMSSVGPLIEPDALRKNVNGTVAGSMPASLTWEVKFVIWATTRHGAVTGETSSRLLSGTLSVLAAAAWTAARSRNNAAVVVAVVSIFTAPVSVRTYQASAVRSTEVVMTWQLSVGRAGG